MTCTCRKWDLCGIPCMHAIAAIQNRKHDAESYINACYSKENYARAFHPLIMPINGKDMWPKTGFTPILPPLEKRKLGRPKMARRIDPSEYISKKDKNKLRRLGQNSVFCRKCGKHGHNRRTCTHESGVGSNVDEDGVGSNVGNVGVQSNVGSVQSSTGDGGSSSGVGTGRGKGTTTVVGRGRSRGGGKSTGMGRGRGTTSELERGTTSVQGRGSTNGLRRGRGTTIGLRRGKGTTNGLGSQITEDTGVECQFQATMVCTRGGGTAFLGRGGRIQWISHEANVSSNYAQATQSSQTAVG
ncbi:GPI-anchored hemophore cfmA-like [Rhododendron vialii]|uniref:GPI-anchored hemophore cfmA-like n=1 Tax=Rhododendron vialii TaxID=182163 RepID=UPI00265E05B4|nr:GPI-anchored hemophore cfmA-like [Rhododendron vialii]